LYTSGHATFSGSAAEVLAYLFPGGRADFEARSDEASISRLYGGIHYRSDLEVEMAHGRRIGGYAGSFARMAWEPERTDGQAAVGATLSIGFTALFNVARELSGVAR
jgi:hypothetical protein